MPTPLQAQAANPTNSPTGDQGSPKPEAPWGNDFDPERAWTTIQNLRRVEKTLQSKLETMERQEADAKSAEMTELEKLKADLDTERQARTAAEQQRTQQLLRTQVVTAAAKAGFNDPEDAIRLLDAETLEINEQGQIMDLDRQLGTLLKAKPYLAKQTGTISPTNPAGGAPGQSDAERLKRIYGLTGTSNIFGGPGGGVVWNTKE